MLRVRFVQVSSSAATVLCTDLYPLVPSAALPGEMNAHCSLQHKTHERGRNDTTTKARYLTGSLHVDWSWRSFKRCTHSPSSPHWCGNFSDWLVTRVVYTLLCRRFLNFVVPNRRPRRRVMVTTDSLPAPAVCEQAALSTGLASRRSWRAGRRAQEPSSKDDFHITKCKYFSAVDLLSLLLQISGLTAVTMSIVVFPDVMPFSLVAWYRLSVELIASVLQSRNVSHANFSLYALYVISNHWKVRSSSRKWWRFALLLTSFSSDVPVCMWSRYSSTGRQWHCCLLQFTVPWSYCPASACIYIQTITFSALLLPCICSVFTVCFRTHVSHFSLYFSSTGLVQFLGI